MFLGYVVAEGSSTRTMLWGLELVLWQSTQVAGSLLPLAWGAPWTLVMYWVYWCSWQEPHFSARDNLVSGVWTSWGWAVWHAVQSLKRCTEYESPARST